jgi:hypothetical protein
MICYNARQATGGQYQTILSHTKRTAFEVGQFCYHYYLDSSHSWWQEPEPIAVNTKRPYVHSSDRRSSTRSYRAEAILKTKTNTEENAAHLGQRLSALVPIFLLGLSVLSLSKESITLFDKLYFHFFHPGGFRWFERHETTEDTPLALR